jgi:calpain-15
MSKKIQLGSGSFISRIPSDGYDEIWEMESNSLSYTEVTLDLRKCTGVDVEGFEGEDEAKATCAPGETTTLFVIHRVPPFKFAIGLSVQEVPAPLEEQEDRIGGKRSELETKIEQMSEFLQKIPFDVMKHDAIVEKLDEFGFDHFLDPSFPPDDTSIYSQETCPEYPLQEKPVWKRPHEFMRKPQLFVGGIDPNDINQGALGNCWFLASIASVAENPALIRRLFITKEYNEKGLYQLRICKNGEWVKVTVDDYIPCYYSGGPMFCRATGDELWVLLLEKAYAKLHGNYVQLRAGFVTHGMSDLTGAPTREYKFPKERQDYTKIKDYADDLWVKLVNGDSRGWIMCAGTPGVDKFTEGGGPNEDHGIVPGHAYSVIACKEHKGVRLMNVRNPWGQFEWGGAWSDNSKEWTKEFRTAINPDFDAKDGSFWMSYVDFFKYFTSISVCKVDNWNTIRLKGIYLRVLEEDDKDEDFVLSKFYYSFHLQEKAEIMIGLHQEDDRVLGAKFRRYVDQQILVLQRHTNGTLTIAHDSGSFDNRDNETTCNLGPGHYIVIPRTCGAALSRPNVNAKDPINFKIDSKGKEKLHPYLLSTMDDIFRRIDLQLNGQLSAEELNNFGNIVNNKFFQSITPETFDTEEFENISCDENGITNFGMRQLMNRLDPKEIGAMLKKLGYDESLYSTKAKPFIISFHTLAPLRVRIGDALKTDLNERARDLMMNAYYEKEGATGAIQTNEIVVFKKYHEGSYSVSFGAINKTKGELDVKFNMNKSKGMIYSPSKGSVNTIAPGKSLVYLATAILDPGKPSFSYSYSFTANKP